MEKVTQITSTVNILNAIRTWMRQNEEKGKTVEFVGMFMVFNSDYSLDESKKIGYGSKEMLSEAVKVVSDDMGKEESDFINW